MLSASPEVPSTLRARALRVLGGTTYIVGDFARGARFHEQSLEEFRDLNDAPEIKEALTPDRALLTEAEIAQIQREIDQET